MSTASEQKERRGWRYPFALFAGPVLWGLQLLAGYGLTSVACSIANKLPVYLLTGVSGLVVLAAAAVGYRAWQTWRGQERSIFIETDHAEQSNAFLAISGFLVSVLFFLVIVATFLTEIFLSPCPIITMPLP